MTRTENIDFVISELARMNGITDLPKAHLLQEKQRLMRALMNIWQPQPLSEDFLQAQDRELQAQAQENLTAQRSNSGSGLTSNSNSGLLSVWQGDITRLQVDAIVNAANSQMLGCFQPLHGCIDNAIHSAAGLQLRQECYEIMTYRKSQSGTPAYQIVDTGSAFEDCLFSKFHPDDERERQALELSYLRMMQTVPIEERQHYNTSCIIRIQNTAGEWRQVYYRVHYRASHRNGSVWLAVCFYSPASVGTHSSPSAVAKSFISAAILNNQTGEIIPQEKKTLHLTKREKQILALISEGLLSKQIADRLCISEHTVNRHRQNIIERLGVSNTAQALHAAHLIGLI